MRGVPDDAAGVIRAGLQRGRDPGHHPAGHELQLPEVRGRGTGHGRVRQRPRSARVSAVRGLLRATRPVCPVQDGRHVRRHVLGLTDSSVLHVSHVQDGVVRDAQVEAQH